MNQPSNNWLTTKSTGITCYREYLCTPHWGNLKTRALKHFDHKCQGCGSVENLHVHHLRYKKWYDCTLQDLTVLCSGCHNLIHKMRRYDKRAVRAIGLSNQLADITFYKNGKKNHKRRKWFFTEAKKSFKGLS